MSTVNLSADVDGFVASIEQYAAKGDGGADEADTRKLCAIIRKQAADNAELRTDYTRVINAQTSDIQTLRDRLAKLESAAQDVADAYRNGCTASSHGDASDVRAAEIAILQAAARLSELMRDEFPEEAIRRRDAFLAKLKAAEKVHP